MGTLSERAWVECPRCGRPARISRLPHRYSYSASAELSCGHCTFTHRDPETFRSTQTRQAIVARWSPRCDKCGRPAARDIRQVSRRHGGELTVRWRCPGCNHTSVFPAHGSIAPIADGHDRWFGLPLVLAEPLGARVIWAYNAEHVEFLTEWLGATLRERPHGPYRMTMMARLPAWMKAASARPKVLHVLARLREKARREGLA